VTLDILRMDVTKELLRKMAKEERALFLALGHASNQVNALWKLVIILTNGDADDPIKQRLEGAQTQVFVRLTIGAMWEAWRLVEDRFLKRPLGREYLPLLDRPAADALERLKKRFGREAASRRSATTTPSITLESTTSTQPSKRRPPRSTVTRPIGPSISIRRC
jgi:hypothetical protein